MTQLNIIVDGEKKREYEFQTLDEKDANRIITLLLMQSDELIATLDAIGSINATDPPELGED